MEVRFVVCVVMLAFLAQISLAVGAFSSRLVHRFSEEAKSNARLSKNRALLSSWPEMKGKEYYTQLMKSDLQRQNMKLGAQYKYIYMSEGSRTNASGNDFGWLHYTWIDVGTPNASFLVALDTGSDLLWLPCDCIQCAPLSADFYSSLSLGRDLSEYSPSGSSTSKHLSCSHELCDWSPICKRPIQPCPYIVKYSSVNTSSSGLLVEDTLHLASSNNHSSKSLVKASVIIGCGREQSGSYLEGVAPDGLMGLGFGNISVPSVLAKAGLVRNSFSMCFDEDGSGRIFFGDQGVANQQSTPFLPLRGKFITYMVGVGGSCVGTSCFKESNFQALVDTGTSFTFIPIKAYKKVVEEFDRKVNATRSSYDGYPWHYCYESSFQGLEMPSLTFVFPLNNSFVVHNPTFPVDSRLVREGMFGFCLAVSSTEDDYGIIGQNFMTGYRIVFDRENMKLLWSHSNCQDLSNSESMTPSPYNKPENPLPTNEQQSSPHGQAVSPAVASRTPSKPSMAPSLLMASNICMVKLPLLLLYLYILVSAV